jgi:hypothetical protein
LVFNSGIENSYKCTYILDIMILAMDCDRKG